LIAGRGMGMSQPRAKRLDVIGLGGGQKLPSRSPRMLYPATVGRLAGLDSW